VSGGMQNFNFLENGWVLGQPDVTGVDIAKNFTQHIKKEDIPVFLNTQVTALKEDKENFYLTLENNDQQQVCQAIILANGTRYLGREILAAVPGIENVAQNKVIEGPYSFIGLENLADSHVVILGAGDNAFENALMLMECGCRVSILARSIPKAQQKFAEKAMGNTSFTLYENANISRFIKCEDTLAIELNNNTVIEDVDRMHILAGYQSNADAMIKLFAYNLQEYLACDENNFLQVDAMARTNIKGVYAAGDICNTEFPSVVSAIASGALAAKTISRKNVLV